MTSPHELVGAQSVHRETVMVMATARGHPLTHRAARSEPSSSAPGIRDTPSSAPCSHPCSN